MRVERGVAVVAKHKHRPLRDHHGTKFVVGGAVREFLVNHLQKINYKSIQLQICFFKNKPKKNKFVVGGAVREFLVDHLVCVCVCVCVCDTHKHRGSVIEIFVDYIHTCICTHTHTNTHTHKHTHTHTHLVIDEQFAFVYEHLVACSGLV
jgi:hypothetical protein